MARTIFKDNKGRNLREGERQKKDGRYEYRYRDIYGIMRSVYSWRLTKADPQPQGKRQYKCLRDLEEEIKRDLHDGIDTYLAQKVTLNERFDLYMKSKINLKESTVLNYRYMYDKYVRGNLGKLKLDMIDVSRMKAFYTSLITQKGLRPITIDNIHTVLNPVFADAVEDDIIRKNPCKKAMETVRAMPTWKDPHKIKSLTCDEQKKFVDCMLSNECFAKWTNVITVLLGTGLRISELRGLTWDDLSFEGDGSIKVNKQLIYREWSDGKCYNKVKTVKYTASERVIPMEPKVREALLAEKERQKTLPDRNIVIDGYSGWVFLNRYGLVLSPKSVNDAINSIIDKYNTFEKETASLEERDPVYIPHQTNHMLRHSYCTRMIEKCCEPNSGIDVKIVQYLMGHNDAKTTLDIYTDVHEEFVKKTMSRSAGQIYLG
ncbi:MAG: site-specific integrase [Clostridia bacterium]|nr:site-specific integrase [Clostridia bacterium]